MPKRPHTRIRFTVLGAEPRCGSTNGAAMSATARIVSTTEREALHSRPGEPSSPRGRNISTSVIAANSIT